MSDLAALRLRNTLALFDEFVAATVTQAAAGDLRGLERMFAEHLRISPSYWSQLKSRERHIGEKLARQFEVLSAKPVGWLDQARREARVPPPAADVPGGAPRDDDERLAVALFLIAYRFDQRGVKRRLLAELEAQMDSPDRGSVAAAPRSKVHARSVLTKIK
jgi:hypothetical protein